MAYDRLVIALQPQIAGDPAAAQLRPRPDVVRRGLPPLALAVAVVAAVTDPGRWYETVVLAVPVAAFALWERACGSRTVALTAGVLAPVTISQLSGSLEPAMFLVSLLVVAVAGWEDSSWRAGACCLAAAATPPLCAALQPADDRIAWGIWVVGVAFPALISRGVYRQEQLTAQLLTARRQLELQAQAEERRRIARDVHDLVGHGLSGVLLQVAGARHVLRRDPDAAEQALAVAEEVGRRSMHELRATVAMLRGADEIATHVPLPDLAGLGALVDAARRDGLTVELRSAGDLEAVDPAVGLALFRIAQEALVNAARHAPRAATVVAATVTGEAVALEVASRGALSAPTDPDRPRYGLIGMRERAATVGGELEAGPTAEGWRVRCRVPVSPR